MSSLKLYLFNVGAGDHLMLEFPDGSIGIIDSFFTSSHLNLQEVPAMTYLKYRVALAKKQPGQKVIISFLCISHADLDHVKEIDLLFTFIKTNKDFIVLENLWLFGNNSGSILTYKSKMEELRKLLLEKVEGAAAKEELDNHTSSYISALGKIHDFKTEWQEIYERGAFYFNDYEEITPYGEKDHYFAYSLGPISLLTDALRETEMTELINQIFEKVQPLINQLPVTINTDFKSPVNKNSVSALLGIHFEDYNMIFTGDAGVETMEASLHHIPQRRRNGDKDLFNPDFIKASHHGSKNSTSPGLWQKMFHLPKGDIIIGISAGRRYSHPHLELYNDVSECCRIRSVDKQIYRTNRCAECMSNVSHAGEIDLDYWFRYHGVELEDIDVEEVLANEAPGNQPIIGKNLVAYIFNFPSGGTNKDIKVYKGMTNKIGHYETCALGETPCQFYCKAHQHVEQTA